MSQNEYFFKFQMLIDGVAVWNADSIPRMGYYAELNFIHQTKLVLEWEVHFFPLKCSIIDNYKPKYSSSNWK
jgi:hypothetical protein